MLREARPSQRVPRPAPVALLCEPVQLLLLLIPDPAPPLGSLGGGGDASPLRRCVREVATVVVYRLVAGARCCVAMR